MLEREIMTEENVNHQATHEYDFEKVLKIDEQEVHNLVSEIYYTDFDFRDLDFSTATKNIEILIKTKDYQVFWYALTHLSQEYKDCSDSFRDKLDDLFSQGVSCAKDLYKNKNIGPYINGLAYFIENNQMSNPDKINKRFKDHIFFLAAMEYGNGYAAKVFGEFNPKKDANDWKKHFYQLAKNKNTDGIVKMLDNLHNPHFSDSMILRMCVQNDITDMNFYRFISKKYHLDMNAVGDNYYLRDKTNFFFQIIMSGNKQLLEQAALQCDIDFNANISVSVSAENMAHNKFLESAFTFFRLNKLDVVDQLNILDSLTKHSNLKIDSFSQICNHVFKKELVSNHYSHDVYQSLFNHSLFLNKDFNHRSVLLSILKNDNSTSIKNLRQKSNYALNPTTHLLDKYYAVVKDDNPQDSFTYWANQQGRNFSISTTNYLLTKCHESFNTQQLLPINYRLKQFLQTKGLNIPDNRSVWKRFLDICNSVLYTHTNEIQYYTQTDKIEVNQESVNTIYKEHYQKPSFNHVLLEQIKDDVIKRYVDSIILNAEQFYSLNQPTVELKEEIHYMNNLLPKFVNKTVENYLHFATLEPEEANNQALTQLKLLNKRTFEVLNLMLEENKESAASESRVISKLINRY